MSSSTCLRSFAQLSLEKTTHIPIAARSRLVAPQASCFSTSATRYSSVPKKRTLGNAPKKGTRTLNVKRGQKAGGADAGKRPAQGERRAIRKRIVLSNNNALEVPSLRDLTYNDALSERNAGLMKGISEDAVDALRAVEAFKPTQGWSLFRRPATLIRKETLQLAGLIKDVESSEQGQAKKTIRRAVVGERMSGKTTLLLQGLWMAFVRQWFIINLPDAQAIVYAHTEYAPVPGSQPTQYSQDVYTANLLSQILKANLTFLESTQVKTNPTLPLPLQPKATLKQLVEFGIANPEASWPVFDALWNELKQPDRPPVLFALDGLSHIMKDSDYLSADVKPIHAHDLSLVRRFVDCLSGKESLPNGGVILAATSSSNTPTNPALDFSIQVAEARQFHPENMPRWNPYKNVDQRALEALKDVDVLKSNGLSKDEAKSIIEYYAESGMLRAKVDQTYVNEKWSLAGMGNIGELERVSVRMRV